MADDGVRLQKVLARLGVASRRGVEDLIRQGRVSVNGQPAELGMRITVQDAVKVDGQAVAAQAAAATYMLNKPPAVLTTVLDQRGRKTVMELVPRIPGLHPVGRLDRDSEGLLLLTTDGDLTLKLTHPRYQHRKTYRVWCEQGALSQAQVQRLRDGVDLEDGPAKAVEVRSEPEGCLLVLAEGRKRQVRRMLAAVGCDVLRLLRTKIGRLELGELPTGGWRQLEADEIDAALGRRD
ncbi:MAG: pseudouridine synthase [Trueperaceae bacterium]